MGVPKFELLGLSGLFLLLAFCCSKILSPLKKIWIMLGEKFGLIVSPLVLAILFFFLLVPTSFLMKLFRAKMISRYPDKALDTYWVAKTNPLKKESFKYQF